MGRMIKTGHHAIVSHTYEGEREVIWSCFHDFDKKPQDPTDTCVHVRTSIWCFPSLSRTEFSISHGGRTWRLSLICRPTVGLIPPIWLLFPWLCLFWLLERSELPCNHRCFPGLGQISNSWNPFYKPTTPIGQSKAPFLSPPWQSCNYSQDSMERRKRKRFFCLLWHLPLLPAPYPLPRPL